MRAAAAIVAGLIVAAGAAAAFEYEEPEQFPAGAGREETFYACVACHNFKLVAAQGMSRERWDDTLTWMTERQGMQPLEPDQRAIVLDYLSASFPPKTPETGAGAGWKNPFVKN